MSLYSSVSGRASSLGFKVLSTSFQDTVNPPDKQESNTNVYVLQCLVVMQEMLECCIVQSEMRENCFFTCFVKAAEN